MKRQVKIRAIWAGPWRRAMLLATVPATLLALGGCAKGEEVAAAPAGLPVYKVSVQKFKYSGMPASVKSGEAIITLNNFTPTELGTFQGRCAEFCGLHHDTMTFTLKVVSQADYVAWVEREKRAAQEVDCSPAGPIRLVAKDNSWNAPCLAVTHDTPFTVSVTNQDPGIEHNFSVYDTVDRKRTIFEGPKFAGPAERSFQLHPLRKGRYYFQCDVHGPAMSGPLVVK